VLEELLQAVFPVRSVPRLYNESQLPLGKSLETAGRRVLLVSRQPGSYSVGAMSEL
jgi:hypothetical protein